MIASFRAEALKSRKRPGNWILFGLLLAILVLLGYVLTYVIFTHPPRRLESGGVPPSVLKHEDFPENLLPMVLASSSTFGAAIMIIFGALSTASEYGWLTVQTILVQKPGRTAVLAGKLAYLGIAALVMTILLLAAGALTSYVLASIDGSAISWPASSDIVKGFAVLWLELSVWTGFGMFFGILFRSAAGAIGGGLTYLFVAEALLGQLLRNTDYVKEVLKFLPGINAGAVNAIFPYTFRNPNALTPLVSAGRGVITLAAWLTLFVLFSALIFRYRDVTGG